MGQMGACGVGGRFMLCGLTCAEAMAAKGRSMRAEGFIFVVGVGWSVGWMVWCVWWFDFGK